MNYNAFEEIGHALLQHPWRFAKTMPKSPHWYTLRSEWEDNDSLFNEAVVFIRKFGYQTYYKGRRYTCLNVNEHKYWTMGSPVKETILINRTHHHKSAPYDEIAEVYTELFMDEKSLHENEALMDKLDKIGLFRKTILDIACGYGLLLDYFTPLPIDYTGIDASSKMLEQLYKKHPLYTNSIIHSRFEEFVGKKYDLVLSLFGSASYIEPNAIQRIQNMLTPDGIYFIMFYHPDYFPETYRKTRVTIDHYKYNPANLSGNEINFGNYIIVTNNA